MCGLQRIWDSSEGDSLKYILNVFYDQSQTETYHMLYRQWLYVRVYSETETGYVHIPDITQSETCVWHIAYSKTKTLHTCI